MVVLALSQIMIMCFIYLYTVGCFDVQGDVLKFRGMLLFLSSGVF